jgi:uncharacterized protein involved in response to NO
MAIPRYRFQAGPTILSAGFRPFFLLSGIWAAAAVPLWLCFLAGGLTIPTAFPPAVWHVHEMVFGYAGATVAGFLLTAIPNWTGRPPLQGAPLAVLALLWCAGRAAVLVSTWIGTGSAAAIDLAFPLLFLGVVAREIIAGRNWRNLPMTGALLLLALGNALVHLDALGLAETADFGNRLGVATLLMLIALVGGRIIPSFTRNWLAKERPLMAVPASFGLADRAALAIAGLALAGWVAMPDTSGACALELAAGAALGVRLVRWRGFAAYREPLVWILHLGYLWLVLGLLLLGLNGLIQLVPQTAALHALTVGAIGTMTLAVMTRATLGHTGRPLIAGPRTTAIYIAISLAAVLRLLAPLGGAQYLLMLGLAAAAWSGAFLLFLSFYAGLLTQPRADSEQSRLI